MSVHEKWLALVKEIREGAAAHARDQLAQSIVVGPYVGEMSGPGFAIMIGEWRIGWWSDRAQACEEARKIGDAIRNHPVRIGLGDA
jgi:hypothetical protein